MAAFYRLVVHQDMSAAAALARGRIRAWELGDAANPTEVLGKNASGQILNLQLRGSQIEYRSRPAAECILVDMTESKQLRERLSETEKLRIEQARLRWEADKAELRRLERDTEFEVRSAWEKLREAEDRVGSSQEMLEIEKKLVP